LAINTVKPSPKWLHHFDTIDSTNNYAIKLIDDGLAQHGDVVWALSQSAGKGQRGKVWETKAGENLLMTLVITPPAALAQSPHHLNMLVAQTIAYYFQQLNPFWQLSIKWPNDIYLNAKKTAGILIENIYRGANWSHSIVGIGVNVNQSEFPMHLHNATSLTKCSGLRYDLLELLTDIRAGILNKLHHYNGERFTAILDYYNQHLFAKDTIKNFQLKEGDETFEAKVLFVDPDGFIHLETENGILKCSSGSLIWKL
jgi:BirA family biotin operon repressor/biotin-[acetyl-CoA-carboxylase] ligase